MQNKIETNILLNLLSLGLFVRGYQIISITISLLSFLYLLLKYKNINYFKYAIKVSLISSIVTLILLMSNISKFYNLIFYISILYVLNIEMINELSIIYKLDLRMEFIMEFIAASITCIIIYFLPNINYSIFTKGSLYLMVSLTFIYPAFRFFKFK